MKHGFINLSAGVPEVSVAAPTKNAESICRLIDEAYEKNAAVLTLPELSVTGYTCSDLFFRSQTQVESIILDIIPCHLLVEFYFRYLTWLECEAQKFTWQSVEDAHHTWESFEKAVPKEE